MKQNLVREMCDRCGQAFWAGEYSFICPNCRKKSLSESAKKRSLNKLGNDARRKDK